MKDSERQASVLLRPRGPLDLESCGAMRSQLAAAFVAGISSIVLDLRDVPSIDLTGLGVLSGASRHLRRREGTLAVVRATPEVARTLRINGLAALLEVPVPSPLRATRDRQDGTGTTPRRPRAPGTLVPVPDPKEGLAQPG